MIYLIGIIIACFLVLLILLKKGKKRPDYVLFAWICLLIVHLLLFYLWYTGVSYRFPHLLGILMPLPLLHGVFLYLYASELTNDTAPKLSVILVHFIPFLVLTAMAIPFFLLPAAEKAEVFRNHGKGFEWYTMIQLPLILVSGFAYSVATIFQIRRYRKRVRNNFSNDAKILLRWLECLTIAMSLIWLLSAFVDDDILFSAVVVFVLFIGFFGINQTPVFYSGRNASVAGRDLQTTLSTGDYTKYAKTGLQDEEVPVIMARLERIMAGEKPFRNGDLTLTDLANAMHIPANQLSQVINSMSGKTFFHYINTWRIREFLAIATLPENRKYTFLALAYDCGFNSKTTFNKYFKLHTGKTPSEHFETDLQNG